MINIAKRIKILNNGFDNDYIFLLKPPLYNFYSYIMIREFIKLGYCYLYICDKDGNNARYILNNNFSHLSIGIEKCIKKLLGNLGYIEKKGCDHKYIPIFTSYRCKHCGKER